MTNGIALCPNLHRAFDRGLVGVSDDYTVMVSAHIDELDDHPYSLSKLNGRSILLPQLQRYHPSQESLAWHRENVFKG
ncbi:HNH endonuclease [Sphingobacterium multivorum]|uniref:HNH endonuclease n=1 Tax=Sphingobacterium multivorum TaxID=28454 RepID=UPI0028A10D9D|nr:HNH endonuclease [Sphingobacterium multivorum]